VEKVRAAGASVLALIGVLDREEGAAENLAELGVTFRPLFKKSDLPVSSG
jgi:orotate phosphoribosyltransferase